MASVGWTLRSRRPGWLGCVSCLRRAFSRSNAAIAGLVCDGDRYQRGRRGLVDPASAGFFLSRVCLRFLTRSRPYIPYISASWPVQRANPELENSLDPVRTYISDAGRRGPSLTQGSPALHRLSRTGPSMRVAVRTVAQVTRHASLAGLPPDGAEEVEELAVRRQHHVGALAG